MELGDNPLKSEEAAKGAAPTELPFINVQRYLARAGAAVPAIYRYDAERGLIYLEDLGDITFESRVADAGDDVRGALLPPGDRSARRAAALRRRASRSRLRRVLARLRLRAPQVGARSFSRVRASRRRARRCRRPSARSSSASSDRIAEELAAEPRGFVHRDYQSRNLMVQDGADGRELRMDRFPGRAARHRAPTTSSACCDDSRTSRFPSALLDDARRALRRRGAASTRAAFARALRSAGRAAQAQGRRALRLHRSREEEPVVSGAHSEQPRLRRALAGASARAGARCAKSFHNTSCNFR